MISEELWSSESFYFLEFDGLLLSSYRIGMFLDVQIDFEKVEHEREIFFLNFPSHMKTVFYCFALI
jgi:hypothetical protein